MNRRHYISILLVLMMGVVAGAAQQASTPTAGTPTASAPTAGTAIAATASASTSEATPTGFDERYPRYELVPGDTLDLKFQFSPEFNQTGVSVQPDGFATLQGIGDVHIAGQTLPELKASLRKQYSKILRDPEITVTLLDFSKPYFIASGFVSRPGKYDLRSKTTLTEAVAIAGGFSHEAKHSRVWVFHRLPDGTVQSKQVDVKHMLATGKLDEDVQLQPGDTLYVPQNTWSKLQGFIVPRASFGPGGVSVTPSVSR